MSYPPGITNADFEIYESLPVRPPERVATIFDDCGELRWDAHGECAVELDAKFVCPKYASVSVREELAIGALDLKLAELRHKVAARTPNES